MFPYLSQRGFSPDASVGAPREHDSGARLAFLEILGHGHHRDQIGGVLPRSRRLMQLMLYRTARPGLRDPQLCLCPYQVAGAHGLEVTPDFVFFLG